MVEKYLGLRRALVAMVTVRLCWSGQHTPHLTTPSRSLEL